MKSKFLRILALILVMSSLISMFAIFAGAETAGGNASEEDQPEDTFRLLYNRTYDEGWDIKNGMELNDQGSTGSTTFKIDHEETLDFETNYFWRLELDSSDNDFVQLNCGGGNEVGAVLEFDVMTDDVCNFSNVVHFGTKGGSSALRSNYNFMRVVNNDVYLMFDYITEPAFKLDTNWMRIQMVFDYTYEKYPIIHGVDTDKEIVEKNELNDKWFKLYVYYGPANGSAPMKLLGNKAFELEAKNGKGLQLFRFQSTGNDKAVNYGTSICFDNMKYYDGVNELKTITSDMGCGTLVNPGYAITEEIKSGDATGSSNDLSAALSMKVGVDYCYMNKTRLPIATAEDGTVYGAPVRVNGEVMIPLDVVLEYVGYPYYVKPGNSIDITTGMASTNISVGDKKATVAGEVIELNAAPGFVTSNNGNEYIAIALSDVEKILPGYYGDYDDMGYMTVSQNSNLLERSINQSAMITIMKEFVFDYYTPESIYNDVKDHTNNFQHPYILANGEQLDMLYNEYHALDQKYNAGLLDESMEEYWMYVHYLRIINSGENAYKLYAKTDSNGTYNTFAGVEPDKYDAKGNNLRGIKSLDQNYLDTFGYDMGGRSDISSRTQYLEAMAFAYVLTKDVKYLQLCYEVAVILGGWTHWGPGHFLNCADSSNDFAVYFDWTYNGYVALAEQGVKRPNGEEYDVKVLAEILARQGVHEGYLSTNGQVEHLSPVVGAGGASYSERVNNWAAVCVGGMTVASLAILGDVDQTYVDEATFILSANYKSLVDLGLDCYAPDGSYNEGPGYWNYGTNNFFRMCAALDSATGGNYGLMDCWGMDTTCYYACHTEDNDGRYFPFHDGTVGQQDTSYFFYVANYFNDATLYDVRLKQINGNVKWASPIDMIYYPRDIEINADEVQLDYYSDNIDLFATRSSWERGALFASIIGGKNNVTHGQIDAGDFVYHNGGNIWIYDLGTENYNCAGFWPEATRYRYYVMKPEGNNTVAITTDPGVPYGQNLNAIADAIKWDSNEHGAYVVYDMGNALGTQVNSWKRGMLLTNDRKTTIIQDQISFKSMQTVYWFAHYSLSYVDKVELSKDGRTAYMRESLGKVNGVEQYQTLRLSIVSPNKSFKFEIMDCYTFVHTKENAGSNNYTYSPDEVKNLGGDVERSRSNYRKLAICSGENTEFEVAVVIELLDDNTVGKNTELDVGYKFGNMEMWEPVADERGNKVDTGNTILRRGIPNVNVHFLQSLNKIADMESKGTLYTTKIRDYYRCLTDAYYVVRTLGVDMPEGHEDRIAALKTYRDAFGAFRDAVVKLQKDQLEFAYKLMSLR